VSLHALTGLGMGPRETVEPFGTTEQNLHIETAFVWEFGPLHLRDTSDIRRGDCNTCKEGECLVPLRNMTLFEVIIG
jgi:hypothetical protein